MVNGIMLLRVYIRDRPILRLYAIHPETYQWWFRLSPGSFEGAPTRRYGFLAYAGIVNRGLRRVALEHWRLKIRTAQGRKVELKPISLPEPTFADGAFTKVYPVLGQKGLYFDGGTTIESGGSLAGMVFFLYECHGHSSWDPRINRGNIEGHFSIEDAFGGRARRRFVFSEKDLCYMQSLSPDIDKVAR